MTATGPEMLGRYPLVTYRRSLERKAGAMEPRERERREVALLLIVLALPALVFWAVTVEAVLASSGVAVMVAGIGALISTLGYAFLAWRIRPARRARNRAPAGVTATIPRQVRAQQRAPVIHRGP
jgi:protein-S-isoprenylcysteine O-methyltransferase Ste14